MSKHSEWFEDFYFEELVVHSDERGSLFEAMRFSSQNIPTGGQLYVYSVAPGARRGDHYHEQKKEWFVCVTGEVSVLLKTPSGEMLQEKLTCEKPKMVYVGPMTSHAVVNKGSVEATIVAYSSKEFDANEPDTVHLISD